MEHSPDLLSRAKKIKTVLLDVDGTLTDGGITYHALKGAADGEIYESKNFSARDGSAIRWALRAGLELGFVTGRSSRVVALRAEELGVSFCEQGVKDKKAFFKKFVEQNRIDSATIACMGDDILDLPLLCRAGLAACPADAVEEVKGQCHFISRFSGGRGAVRDFLEFLLKAQAKWNDMVRTYMGSK